MDDHRDCRGRRGHVIVHGGGVILAGPGLRRVWRILSWRERPRQVARFLLQNRGA